LLFSVTTLQTESGSCLMEIVRSNQDMLTENLLKERCQRKS
jgi:hypothetical protein